jgi:hypothetical protein
MSLGLSFSYDDCRITKLKKDIKEKANRMRLLSNERWLNIVKEMLTACEQHPDLPPSILTWCINLAKQVEDGSICESSQYFMSRWYQGHTTLCEMRELLLLSPARQGKGPDED